MEVEEKYEKFQVLDLFVPSDDDYTFYDALDKVIWLSSDEGSEVFVDFADIVCIKIQSGDTPRRGCRLDIPAIFYPDRYTEAWTESVHVIKKQIEEKRCLIDDIEIKEDKLKRFRSSKIGSVRNPPVYEPKLLLEQILEHMSTPQPAITPITYNEPESTSGESLEDAAVELQQDIAMGSQKILTVEVQSEDSEIIHMLKDILSQLEKKMSGMIFRHLLISKGGI